MCAAVHYFYLFLKYCKNVLLNNIFIVFCYEDARLVKPVLAPEFQLLLFCRCTRRLIWLRLDPAAAEILESRLLLKSDRACLCLEV